MVIENINIDGVIIPHTVIKIKGDGACLFNSISYIIYQNEVMAAEVRSRIVDFVSKHWTEFSVMSHDREGNNYGSANEYIEDMSKPFTYGGLCELKAAGQIFPFLFEVYVNFDILRKFGSDINPIKRLRFSGDFSNGHFDVYLPLNEIDNCSANENNINTIDNSISVSCNKTAKKRRARYTNNIRKKQQKIAAINYRQSHPEVHQNAVSKYQKYNPEIHRAAQARYKGDNPEKIRELKLRPWKRKFVSGFAYDPDINYENDIGEINNKCPFCNAKRFTRESHNMCCSNGKVQLQPLLPPPEPLNNLLMGNHHDHRHFLDHIRQYNGCFQMTSFGAKQVIENGFMPTFKVQGQVYHFFGSLQPEENQEPQFLQIYFVGDDEKEASIRSSKYSGIRLHLVRELQRMLHNVNIYVKDFKTALENMSPTCENFKVVLHADRKPANSHKGLYNAPTTSEVAVVIVGQQFEQRDVVIESRKSKLKRISELHRAYDALQYPLMFCYGEDGYSINVPQIDPTTNQPLTKTVSATQFYSYRIMSRDGENNYLLRYCALFSQFLVDEYAKIETERLNYLRHNQTSLRAEEYIHLRDDVGKIDADQLGQHVILPSSFNGGPRYMHERAQDAMTYVRQFGSSDLFLTFTCNPKWKEIQRELYPGQKHYQRHDIIARVFNLKVKELMDLIIKGQIFGKVRCYMFTVEWQKRGLPHIHLLLWLKDGISNDMIDKVVCAEIPDPQRDPLLYDVIKSNMVHGPCGSLNRNSPCMKDGSCTKRYPRPLVKETQKGEDSYPLYRRRSQDNGGFILNIKGAEVDNRWIVPYNPVLVRTFKAHINVEITNSVKAIKYICKYVTKGNDQAVFALEKNQTVNEIEMYENGRYISTSEAVWRILSFPIHDRYPTVTHLAVHLENGQRVYFNKDNVAEKLANPPITTLLAFFILCQTDDFARTLLYSQVPSYYVFQKNKTFTRRKRGENVSGWPGVKKDAALGRVYTIHPNNIECFHLRLLLHHVRGPTSFSNLKTVNNVEYPTFKAVCMVLGLLEDDKHWEHTIDESVVSCSAFQLRELFTIILMFCSPSDPQNLWNKYKDSFSEDIMFQLNKGPQNCATLSKEDVYNRCLILIEDKVLALGGDGLSAYGLPITIRYEEYCQNIEYVKETNYDIGDLIEKSSNGESSLTKEQFTVYHNIWSSVESGTGQIFFLDAPGGTGKTFLINILLAKVRSKKYIAIATATSGIAATLLDGGKTAHSAFKLPLNLNHSENPLCNIKKQSNLAQSLRQCRLIVWDEITMAHKGGIEALHTTLQDIRNSNELMGGITVLLAGDFRQTLPVIPRGTRANEVKACIKSSYLWPHVQRLTLNRNMRVHLTGDSSAIQFSHILLDIGNGKYSESGDKVTIPPELGVVVTSLEELISKVYYDIADIKNKPIDWLCERAILSPKNDKAAEINDILLNAFAGEDLLYKSIDKTLKEDEAVQYPTEFLNTLNPSGFPPHILRLKVGTPVMMLRNLCPPKLCNGTRLQVTSLCKNVIEARIITGNARGQTVLIPRIPLIPSDYPFEFTRLQFPIKVCFATTINKSQGQSLKTVGVDLREDCFSHGQLYVACSRVSSPKNLIILAPCNKIKNIVYKEVLL